jgi:hypothetical protein
MTTGPQANNHPQVFNPNLLPLDGYAMGNNAFFDFSGPLGIGTWDEAMLLSPNSWPSDPSIAGNSHQFEAAPQSVYQIPLGRQSTGPLVETTQRSRQGISDHGPQPQDHASTSPFSVEHAPNGTVDEDFLLNTFLQMLMPPILTPVEIGPKMASTRAFFGTMAAESMVVKSAIMAFAAMQMQRNGLDGNVMKTEWRPLYDSAARHLSSALAKRRKEEETDGTKTALKYILASLFLLIYTDVSSSFRVSSLHILPHQC